MSAKTFTSIAHVGSGAWTYTWTGTAPFRVFMDGELYDDAYTLLSLTVDGSDLEEPPVVEVCEAAETVESEAYPRKPTAQWFGTSRASGYNIYVSAVYWDSVPEDNRGYYTYSGFADVDDGTTITATIVQVDEAGNESASIPFTWLTFRYPDPPLVTYSYVAVTGTFTASVRV